MMLAIEDIPYRGANPGWALMPGWVWWFLGVLVAVSLLIALATRRT